MAWSPCASAAAWARRGCSRYCPPEMIRPALLVLAMLALAGCATPPPAGPRLPDPKTQMVALETRIAILVEEQRQKLDPKARNLAIDPELSRIARARAADMAAKN